MSSDAVRPVAALTPYDRVLALCESDEERAEIQRLCVELNLGTHGAELNFMLVSLELAAMRAQRAPKSTSARPVSRLPLPRRAMAVGIDRRYGMVAVGVGLMLISWLAGHSPDAVALLFALAGGLIAGGFAVHLYAKAS